MSFGLSGSKRITAAGGIGATGKPYRLFSIHLVSGGTGSVLSIKNLDASGNVWVKFTGTANTGSSVDFHDGILIPGGLYADTDANIVSAVISGRNEA